MFTLGLNFDVMFILIMISMMAIGYITGANIEIIKLVKVYTPFIVVFYLGGPLSRIVYRSEQFKGVISAISVFDGMPYFNTLVMFISTFIAFFGAYFIIGLIIKFIQKRIQTESVNYKLGKFNNKLGAIVAIARFYVVFSIVLIPFFMLGFTQENDFSTKLILNYPPPYTQVGRLVKSSQPVLKATNSVSNFVDVVDIEKLKEYYSFISDLPSKLSVYDDEIKNSCGVNYPGADDNIDYSYLYAYVKNPSVCSNENFKTYLQYKGLIIWAYEENIDLSQISSDVNITSFNTHYQTIIENTPDDEAGLIMQGKIEKAHSSLQIYQIVNNWLAQPHILGPNYDITDILADASIENIINQLSIDKENENDNGLFHDLAALNNEELNNKLSSLKKFIKDYPKYKIIMDTMPQEMPFKYRLIASTLENFNFLPSLNRTPLMAMYVIDTFEMLNNGEIELMSGEPLYRSLDKIMIPVYVIKKDANGNLITFTANDMAKFLTTNCSKKICSIDDAFEQVVLTDDFFIDLLYELVNTEDGDIESYAEYLVTNQTDTNQPLMEKQALLVLRDYVQNRYRNSEDERVGIIISELSRVGGDLNG